ncbi:hypothetical protein EGM51_02940 [Verrucomicrobia bacterium S94]|nr:hypothetical protein EGM51_02940 [Verrucomicrobia bacterium S94]
MKMKSPLKGIMKRIRNLKEPVAEAMSATESWMPMWNNLGMAICPVQHTQQTSNSLSADQQR